MTTTGHRWKSAEFVQEWVSGVESRPLEKARRIAQFTAVTDMLPFGPEARFRVVDLGSGWGALLQAVLTAFPNATGVCLDSSPAMLELGREMLVDLRDRIVFLQRDLEDPLCLQAVDGDVAAIVSSRAIHHLAVERKKALYREIYERLTSKGCFINVDHVRSPDLYLTEAYRAVRIREAERAARAAGLDEPTDEMLSREGRSGPPMDAQSPLVDQLTWLEDVGFRAVDVWWKYLGTAVFGGFKLGQNTASQD